MAKFKKGDGAYIKKTGDFCKIISEMPKQAGRVVYKVKILVGPARGEEVGLFEEDLISEGEHQRSIGNSRACNGVRSRNAVVAKALNACARNGGIDDFKVGDRVMVRSVVGFTPTDPMPGTVTAIYKSDNRIAVKKDDGGRGLFDASMVTKNACGTARNANFGSVEDAERYSEQAIRAAKSRINGEVVSLTDVIKLLKGYPDSKTVQKNLVTLQWALDAVKKAAQTLA